MTLLFILIILTAVVAVTGTIIYTKSIKDDNDNMIPDQVEDVVKEVKKRGKRVKQEVDDVAEDIVDAIKGIDDIAEAAKGSKRKGRPKKNSR